MPYPSAGSILSIVKEVTKGTVPSTGFFQIPVSKIDPQDHQMYLADKNWRGSAVDTYGQVAGPLYSEFTFGGDVFLDTIGFPIAGVLGDYASTGTSPSVIHTCAVKNSGDYQATSYSIIDQDRIQPRSYAAQQFSDLTLTFNADGLLTYDAKSMGYGSATATAPTASFSTLTPIAAYTCVPKIGGTAITNLMTANMSIKRPVTPIHTADNSASPYKIWQGPVSFEGTMSVVMEDETNLLQYLNNSQPSLEFLWTQGTSTLKVFTSKAAFTVGKINRGTDHVALDLTFVAIANSTDVGASAGFSPVKVTLTNSVATGTYA
jgi:hypothetical protein